MMNSLGSLLESFEPLKFIRAWKKAAGPVFEKQAQFHGVRLQNNVQTLFLSVADPMWKQEILFDQEALLQAYANALAHEGVSPEQFPKKLDLVSTGSSRKPFKRKR